MNAPFFHKQPSNWRFHALMFILGGMLFILLIGLLSRVEIEPEPMMTPAQFQDKLWEEGEGPNAAPAPAPVTTQANANEH